MSDERRKALVGLPTYLRQSADTVLTKDQPAHIGHPQSPRSRPSNESLSPPTHHLTPNASAYPVVPPFRLASERLSLQQDPVQDKDKASLKRKRPPEPAPTTSSEPPIEDKDNESLKRKRSHEPAPASSKPETPGPAKICRFQGVIEHRRWEEAMDFAADMGDCELSTDKVHRHIFWTDGSIVQGACAAAAVVWKQPPSSKWMTEGHPYPYLTQNTEVVEMFAIAHALRRAVDEVRQARSRVTGGPHLQVTHEVFVFTDSLGALNSIKEDAWGFHTLGKCEQAHTIIDYSIELRSLGARLELHLVPGHSNVPGNMEAHRAAKKAAHHTADQAGITSNEEGFALHKKQGSVAIIVLSAPLLVPASPVPARCSKGSRGRALRKYRDLLAQPIRNLTPLNAGSTLATGDQDKTQIARVITPALSSLHWFTPIKARQTPSTVDSPQSQSVGEQEPVLKKRKIETAAAESLSLPGPRPFGPGLFTSNASSRRLGIDNARSFFKAGRLSYPPAKDVSAAILNTPQSIITTSKMRSFASPEEPRDGLSLATISSIDDVKPNARQSVTLPSRPLWNPDVCPTPTSVFMASQMKSFASPEVPKDGLTLAPNSWFHEGKMKQIGELPVSPSIRDVPKTPAFFVTTSKLRSFASPGEPQDGPTLAPIPPSFDGELQDCGAKESSEHDRPEDLARKK
ncbi:uncharacterized protein N7496_004365 [Penicillium cataractarum]|uniref:RNase H type-1 domain-containing protein n=1 Tax=Penicillium cataractarum TaxID=2100454 RepID=A0A9W9SNV4_9EURO|nr:uncharacterized protein N7496_004365 [Penicillium cataractarum]KAJ5381937.1 hypothetical protein N7496_004365 [Penicillium cataractarum]